MNSLDPTTHTVEMAQIAELNDRLARRVEAAITAADLGLAGAPSRGSAPLAGDAALVRVSWDGSPVCPYIHGDFGGSVPVLVDLHTAALRELSRRLHLRHLWGVGSAPLATG